MTKGYWIANVTVTDAQAYSGYQAVAPEAFAAHGARFLARGAGTSMEGRGWQRTVVIEFDSVEVAKACYESEDYRDARAKRAGACEADIVIVEGVGE